MKQHSRPVPSVEREQRCRPLREDLIVSVNEREQLAACELHEFAALFVTLRAKHPDATAVVGEALLGRRDRLGKAELNQIRQEVQEVSAGLEQSVASPRAKEAWPPDELMPLTGALFSRAVYRLTPAKRRGIGIKDFKPR